ncbi:MAG: alpha/beta fold hydrolase [Dehalococcoidia bacterium]|nr:alpha/beta fold hydrolase [Dehalococcoidia bacterium]
MPTASVNGIELNYREAGEGFPIVLIHGFTGNLRNWALTVPALVQQFRTICVDLRGHGHSHKPTRAEDYTAEAMAEDVHGLMRHLGIAQCYLAGHSMGGMVAQQLILAHPSPFRALVLVDTAAEIPDSLLHHERRAERERLVEIAREQGMEAVFEEQLKASPQAPLLSPQFLNLWREQFLLTSRDAYIHCAQAMGKRRPLLEKLPAVQVPALIICGENDEPFVESSRRMHERIAGSDLVMIAGAGHTPQIEKAQEFNAVLTGFLARVHQTVAAGG